MATAYLLYDFGWAYSFLTPGLAMVLEGLSLHPHFGRFSEGLVSLADITYFVVLAAVAGAIVRTALGLRRVGV